MLVGGLGGGTSTLQLFVTRRCWAGRPGRQWNYANSLGETSLWGQQRYIVSPHYLDMSCCEAEVARVNVPILSLKIIVGESRRKKNKKIGKTSCLLCCRSTTSVLLEVFYEAKNVPNLFSSPHSMSPTFAPQYLRWIDATERVVSTIIEAANDDYLLMPTEVMVVLFSTSSLSFFFINTITLHLAWWSFVWPLEGYWISRS